MNHSKEQSTEASPLRELGFDRNAPAEAAVAKLRALRSQAVDMEIARVLGSMVHADAVGLLAEMERGASGALRREIRRSLFKLHQRGIEPPATSSDRARPAPHESGLSAMLSPIDPEGARLVWLLKARRQGGMLRLWGLVSDSEGLVGANVTNLSRRELREERGNLERQVKVKLIDADPALADFILCEGYRNTPEQRRARVGNFLGLRAELITSAPPVELSHPVYSEVDASGEPSLELLKEAEMLEWRLPDSMIRKYIDEISRANESVIVLNQMQQQERVATVVTHAIGELLTGEAATRIRRRLEDLAYYMARSGRKEQAGWAASAAAKIRDGTDLKRSAFFEGFIRSQLATTVAAEQERAKEEPRLIMTPAEAMRSREAAARRR